MRTIVIAVLALCAMACAGPALAADAQTWMDRQSMLKGWLHAETPAQAAQAEKDSGMSRDQAQKVIADWITEEKNLKDGDRNDWHIAALEEFEESLKWGRIKETQAEVDQQADNAERDAVERAKTGLAEDWGKIWEDINIIGKAERDCQLLGTCSDDDKTRMRKIAEILELYAEKFKISCEQADIVRIVLDAARHVALLTGPGFESAFAPPSARSDTALERALTEILTFKCAKFKILLETSGSGQHVDVASCVQPIALDVRTRVLVTLDSVEKLEGQVTYWGSGKADHVVTKYTHAIHSCAKGDHLEPIIAKSSEPMEIRLRLLPNTTNDLQAVRRFQVDIKPGRINMTWNVITSPVNYEWWDEMWKSHYKDKDRAAGGYYRFEVEGKITATKVAEAEFSGTGSYQIFGTWTGTEKTKITIERPDPPAIVKPATVKPTVAQPANVQPVRPQ